MALTSKQFVERMVLNSKGHMKKYNVLEYAAENNGIEALPVGHIMPYMGLTAPRHYLICDGAEYSGSEYPELFNHLSTFPQTIREQWGNADWISNFNVPKLQGEFLRGAGTNGYSNEGSGADVGMHQTGTTLPRMATTDKYFYVHRNNASDYVTITGNPDTIKEPKGTNKYVQLTGTLNTETLATGYYDISVRPTNTSVLLCIRYEPSYNIKVDGKDIYSIEEKLVGYWVDGKPLYEKVVDIGSMPNANRKNISCVIDGLDKVIDIRGFCISSAYSLPIPYAGLTTEYGIGCHYNNTKKEIVVDAASDRSSLTGYITLRYTKTTD